MSMNNSVNNNESFSVLAGTYDDEYENIKFCDDFDTLKMAQECVKERQLKSYVFCRIEHWRDGEMIGFAPIEKAA